MNRAVALTAALLLALVPSGCGGPSGAENLTVACSEVRLANRAIIHEDRSAVETHAELARQRAEDAVVNGSDSEAMDAVVVAAAFKETPNTGFNVTLALARCDEVGY